MKKLIACFLFSFLITALQAQTAKEWTRQKKTQNEYLVQQIAALRLYTGVVQKGYGVAKDGLEIVHKIRRGDVDLHKDYFTSRKRINEAIRYQPTLSKIMLIQRGIEKECGTILSNIRNSKELAVEQRDYLQKVYAGLLEESRTLKEELSLLSTANKIALTDDERIKRLHALYEEVHDLWQFAQSFSKGVSVLALQKGNEQASIKAMKAF